MDLLQKGKALAQDGKYEEAMDAFLLALENDKENPDIHFYLGACYSALEQFRFARYHYEIAIRIAPDHEKTRMVLANLKDVVPEKPPETNLTRGAAARARRAKNDETEESGDSQETLSNAEYRTEPRIKLTDEKWEKAFPADDMIRSSSDSPLVKVILFLAGAALLSVVVFFILQRII